ncbi:MAG: repeat-containing protein [Bacteroidetes bacterium]|jgi:hypothetical protein|nr:repeat-containing protein [Bacteroidota bacterium]
MKTITFFFVLFFLNGFISRGQNLPDTLKPGYLSEEQMIFHPFYKGVQMIEVDHVGYWHMGALLEPPMDMAYYEPPPPPNEYYFRDTGGAIIKAFNTTENLQKLTERFKRIPIYKKNKVVRHAGREDAALGTGGYSSDKFYFFEGFYKVYGDPFMEPVPWTMRWEMDNTGPSDRTASFGRLKGLIDSLGNIRIPIEYEEIFPLRKNLLVKKKGKWGILDKRSKVLLPLEYDECEYVSENLVFFRKDGKIWKLYIVKQAKLVDMNGYNIIQNAYNLDKQPLTMVVSDGKVGFLDSTFAEAIPLIYDAYDNRGYKGIVRALKDKKWGFMTQQGKEVLPFIYDDATRFEKDGIAVVKLNGVYCGINTKGEVVKSKMSSMLSTWPGLKGQYICYRENLYGVFDSAGFVTPLIHHRIKKLPGKPFYAITDNEKTGLMDSLGNLVVPFRYDEIDAANGKILIRNRYKYGYMNNAFSLVIPCEYDNIVADTYGLIVHKNERTGMLDTSGQVLLPVEYDWIQVYPGKAHRIVKKGERMGYIDSCGKIILPVQYEWLDVMQNGLILFKQNGKAGFISIEGKLVVDPVYEEARPFEMEVTCVKKEGKWGFIDKKGKVLTEFKYNTVPYGWRGNKYIEVRQNGKSGVIDNTGKEIIPCIYDSFYQYDEKGDILVFKLDDTYVLVNAKGKRVKK